MLKIIGIGLIVLALLVLSAPGIPNAHATGGLPESTTIPSYITVSEVGLPPGYDWTIQTWIQTPGRQITINESIPDGSSAYVSTAGLVGFDAYFQAWQPVGGIYKYVGGNFIGFPLGGVSSLLSPVNKTTPFISTRLSTYLSSCRGGYRFRLAGIWMLMRPCRLHTAK